MANGVATIIRTSGGVSIPIVSDASTLTTVLETKDLFVDSQDVVKFIQRLRYIVRNLNGSGLTVKFKYRNNANEAYQESTLVPLGGDAVDVRIPGAKLVRVRFESVGSVTRWLLSQFDLLGQLGGARELR